MLLLLTTFLRLGTIERVLSFSEITLQSLSPPTLCALLATLALLIAGDTLGTSFSLLTRRPLVEALPFVDVPAACLSCIRGDCLFGLSTLILGDLRGLCMAESKPSALPQERKERDMVKSEIANSNPQFPIKWRFFEQSNREKEKREN